MALQCAAVLCAASAGCFSPKEDRQAKANDFLDDKVTQARIDAALHASSSSRFSHVQVTVTNGTAYLSGIVPTKEDQQNATQLAEGVHRVKRVDNQTRVEASGSGNFERPR